jgi:hypothetical protein
MFAKGAQGSLTVEVPDFFAVYSLNNKFVQNYSQYVWEGEIDEKGFEDLFNLTLKKAKWKATTYTEIKSNESLKGLELSIPEYLKNGNNQVESYNIETQGEIVEQKDSRIRVDFSKENNIAQVKIESVITNDFDNKVWVKLDPNKYLAIDKKLSQNLQNTIDDIKDADNNPSQLYITLAEWVHKHIKYDMAYFGKDMTTEQILKTGRGVCEQYAQLYNDLLRASGIPSVVVSGMSYDPEKNKFENHAWNLVFTNGDWIGIDPTWGLYSGKLPISHIFFNFKTKKGEIEWKSYATNTQSKFNRNVEFIE